MSISSYFMSKFYDASMQKMEAASLSIWRKELLSYVSGDVLEIGSGTGVNLEYYNTRINTLTLTEPDNNMLSILERRVKQIGDDRFKTVKAAADDLPFDDNQYDAVVITLVLCSVKDQQQTLTEIKRVLKPGGKIYFIEHVLAKQEPRLIKWQKILQPLWVCACGSCHLTRDTETSIVKAGFEFEKFNHRKSDGCPAVVSPCISGVAVVN